tara:strand:+ start:300 stop:443 length:144 start_codon:yes stop_codon:yes gene_type:complete
MVAKDNDAQSKGSEKSELSDIGWEFLASRMGSITKDHEIKKKDNDNA